MLSLFLNTTLFICSGLLTQLSSTYIFTFITFILFYLPLSLPQICLFFLYLTPCLTPLSLPFTYTSPPFPPPSTSTLHLPYHSVSLPTLTPPPFSPLFPFTHLKFLLYQSPPSRLSLPSFQFIYPPASSPFHPQHLVE